MLRAVFPAAQADQRLLDAVWQNHAALGRPETIVDHLSVIDLFWANGQRRSLTVIGENGSRAYSASPPTGPIPLLNSSTLQARPAAPVLMFTDPREAALVPAEAAWVATAAPLHVARADFAALKGRDVIVVASPKERSQAQFLARAARAGGARLAELLDLPSDPSALLPLAESARRRGASAARGPDLTLADRALTEVPALDPALLGLAGPAVAVIAATRCSPTEYVAASLLGAVSGIVTGLVTIEPRPGWSESAPLWFGLVGDSGSGKTPAMGAMDRALASVEAQLLAQHSAELATWKKSKTDTPAPVVPLLRTDDSTIEAVAHALAGQKVGLISWQGEMAAWVAALSRYSSSDRGFWLKAFDAAAGTVMRRAIGPSPLMLPTLGLSIVAGVQPEVLKDFLSGPRDGLSERFCFLWPNPSFDFDPPAEALAQADAAQATIQNVIRNVVAFRSSRRRIAFTLAPEAAEHFFGWRRDYLSDLRHRHGAEVPGAAAKAPGLCLRLAAALQVLDDAVTGPLTTTVLQGEVIDRALRLTDVTLAHRRRVERDCQEPEGERGGRMLARHIVEQGLDVLDVQQLRRSARLPGLRDPEAVRAALSELIAARWVIPGTTVDTRRGAALPPVVPIRSEILAHLSGLTREPK